MIYTIANVTTTAGVPKQFITTRTPANWVLVTALSTNTGANVWIGGSNPTNKSTTLVLASTSTGIQIAKGATQLISPISSTIYIDLETLWFDVSTTNDGISITYAVR